MPNDIVGRNRELAAVEAWLRRSARSLAALVLEGEAGIGKTTIWEAGVDAANQRGELVLAARQAHSEQGLTLGGLTDLLGEIGDDDLGGLPEPQRRALGVALLRVAPSGAAPDQRMLSVAVAGLLRRLASPERPILLAVDDAQWLDESSAAILAYAVRRLADRPVGLLMSVRTGAESPASDGLVAAAGPDRLEQLAVGPLPLGSLHHLLEARLGRSFPRLVLVRIEAASGGNPLYALEIGRAIARAGIPATPREALPLPRPLAALMAARIDALPSTTRGALLLAAAAFEPTLATLEAAGVTEAQLAPAVEHGVLLVEGDDTRFAHPLLAHEVLALARPPELRAAHATLARATVSPDARARHLGEAAEAPDEIVAGALATAAAAARDRGASLAAAALYQDAARLTPDAEGTSGVGAASAAGSGGGLRLRRSLAAAECLFVDLSEIVEADAILDDALRSVPAGPPRAEALSIRALLRYYRGRVEEAIDLGRQAVAEAGDEPILRATVFARAAFVVMQLDLEGGVSLVDEAVRLLEGAAGHADPDLLANALLLRAVGELGLVRAGWARDLQRGLGLMSRDGRSWEHEGADGSAFGIARMTDDLDRAIQLTQELIRTKSGPAGDDPFNLVQLSGLVLLRGDLVEARRLAEAAIAGYEHEGADVHPAWGLRGLALVAAHDGRLDDARRWAGEGLARARERGDVVVQVFHHQVLAFVAISTEAWAAADAHLVEAAALAEGIATRHPGRFKLAGDEVEAALALGDAGRAAAIVARLQEVAAVAPTPWLLCVGARCEGLLAAARGDPASALAAFERALREHERLPMPFERGRTLLAKGRLHRRRKEKRLADETLREALSVFESLGAPAWADRTRAELGRVGRRPRASDQLTDTEALVADLAARGLSNRRIAEQSFLAPKTVGNVLGRVYQKLDIHSRAELGAAVASSHAAEGRPGAEMSRPHGPPPSGLPPPH